jgi:glutamyl-tRNA synthetase
MAQNNDIIVRFPPSPTGFLHIGNARTFLFNYLFAKKNSGKIVFRLEDTDKERSNKEYEADIIENLKWLEIEPDFSSQIRQSERGHIYKKYIEEMIVNDKAYISKEKKTEEGQRDEVIRFKNPNKEIKFTDLIRGEIKFDTTELGDFVIAKSLEEPVYHLAVVIDDFLMGVTHIIRGDDGISNTPRQILIQESIGANRPTYAHLPLMLAPDKTKLSKRKHGETVSVKYYREKGYIKEAVINYLALVGWNPGINQELFSLDELINFFDIKKVQKKGAIFDLEKLNWINRQYLLQTPLNLQIEEFKNQMKETKFANHQKLNDPVFVTNFLTILTERINVWSDIKKSTEEGEYDYLFEEPEIDQNLIKWKNADNPTTLKHLLLLKQLIEKSKDKELIIEEVKSYAEKEGKGDVLWPLRYSLSGREKSPDPFTLLNILKMEDSIARLSRAIRLLS